ncbi:MAG: alkaline phosphatase family protein [Anaerolineae bacterium]|nr:alkaline phosphatase family protein [Anaerolineae bacterium]
MYLPDYHGGSIVNLMSSIGQALGGESLYAPLTALLPAELAASRNIVLLVIDGLGYEYLTTRGQDSVFYKHLRGQITSVFPSTTAACVTTFATGVAPQQHAITGWFVHLKELGVVSAILPFKPRHGGPPFGQAEIKAKDIFDQPPLTASLKADSYAIMPKDLVKSDYNQATAGRAKLLAYRNLGHFFKRLRKTILSGRGNRQQYIYAYWPKFDTLSHEQGNGSQKTARHFAELNKKLSAFLASLKHTDTTLIITADHGFIDNEAAQRIELKNHPKLQAALALPLCGEGRAAYCYVRPAKTAQFEDYVAAHLGDKAELFKSEALIAQNYFGLFEPHPRLFDRVGDYVLLMKDNYVIRDSLLGESRQVHIGYHGGVSKAEMFVPLIVIKK